MMNRHFTSFAFAIGILALAGCNSYEITPQESPVNAQPPARQATTPTTADQGVGPDRAARDERFVPRPVGVTVTDWVTGLEVPWSLVFVSASEALVSERPGRIRRITNARLTEQPWATVDVETGGERGLMGLAIHPDFPSQPFVYAMYSYQDGGRFTRVVRFRYTETRGTVDRVILDRIPGARFHDGGRIAFGPDGMLYVCTGDATEPASAQNLESLAGKILRLTPDGAIPPDNPISGSPVYAYGLRNPQGLAWHPDTGELIAADHGPTGERGRQAHDEVNHIRPGGNYGWPEHIGAADDPNVIDPLVYWPERAVPPGGIVFDGDILYVATMRSEALVRIPLTPVDGRFAVGPIERWFANDDRSGVHGRFRDVVRGPDGALYLLTTNRDGRGTVRSGDDRILRLVPTR